MKFFLGTHEPSWLTRSTVPLFVSRRRLVRLKQLLPATCEWSLDSGGFTELNMHGQWSITATEYASETRRYAAEIGRMQWAAIQDWMCEPFVLDKTKKSIREHQILTVKNCVELRALAPEIPWCPVLQGWTIDDYFVCVDMYADNGIDLSRESIVGVGSVCRRQGTSEIAELFGSLATAGIATHAFGLKTLGLKQCRGLIKSADSLAWSYRARRDQPLKGCKHKSCANCYRFAMQWRESLLRESRPSQRRLFA